MIIYLKPKSWNFIKEKKLDYKHTNILAFF